MQVLSSRDQKGCCTVAVLTTISHQENYSHMEKQSVKKTFNRHFKKNRPPQLVERKNRPNLIIPLLFFHLAEPWDETMYRKDSQVKNNSWFAI